MDHSKAYPGFWHAVLLCTIFVGMQVASMIPIAVVDAVLKTDLITHPAVLGTGNLVACTMVLLVGWCIGRPPMREVFTLRRVSISAIAGVVIASAGSIIIVSELDNLMRRVLPPPEGFARLMEELVSTKEHPLAAVFLLVIIAPVTEELMFRGLILRGFLRRFRIPGAFLLSAMLFGAVHLNPWQFVSATALGLMFAWWYLRTKSLIPSLLGHALVNAMCVGHRLLPFEIRGFNPENPTASTELQPFWFDALGILLLAAGFWLFRVATPPIEAREEPSPNPLRPSIPPEAGVPPPTFP